MGLRKIKFKSEEFIILFPVISIYLFVISYSDYTHLKWLNMFFPNFITLKLVNHLRLISPEWHFIFLFLLTVFTICFVLGFKPYARIKKLQKDLDTIGLVNSNGVKAKIISEITIDDNRTKVLLIAKGIGIDRVEAKSKDIESAFERIIENISISFDRKMIEILMCKKELRKLVNFNEIESSINAPYSFLVGETANGIIKADIRELPHLLIAGSTGGGKSAFFRQVFMSLLKNSQYLQVYLLDLKRGIEVKEFAQLPNVRVAKDELEAVKLLQSLHEEMQRRFAFMEQNGIKKIDPKTHKKDLIVIGIDEASVLYGKTTGNKEKAVQVAKARELTDELAKLARAAGIHLVIATQKPLKESLDTKTLENLTGRMIFKMSTHAGSNVALGNAKAYSLPDVKGRGIWAGGNKYIEVQTPFLSEVELDEECKELSERLHTEGMKNFQSMVEVNSIDNEDQTEFKSNLKQRRR